MIVLVHQVSGKYCNSNRVEFLSITFVRNFLKHVELISFPHFADANTRVDVASLISLRQSMSIYMTDQMLQF